jgi:predicted ArsR family transcriptional regulator
MAQEFGPSAVEAFATARARQLADSLGGQAGAATPQDVADALTRAGYAAVVEPLGDVAVQLCQHHCPVVDAAREFPVLCETETAELGRLMGRHVTRLATLAHGDEVCTAVIAADPTQSSSFSSHLGKVPA